MRYDDSVKLRAAELFEKGAGYKRAASILQVPRTTAKSWQYACRALGKEALLVTSRKQYDHGLKVAAARDVVEGGMAKPDAMAKHGIASLTALENWCRAYREGGAEALLPKPKGRPRKSEAVAYASREEELEARILELELELEIQKRVNALADGIERRSHRR